MDIFLFAANAVLPIVLFILIGYLLKIKGFLTKDFLAVGNKIVFHICLPSLVFYNIYNIPSFDDINWRLVVFSLAMALISVFAAIIFCIFFVKERPSRGTIVQCVYRANFGIIGIPLALSLGGTNGAAAAAVISAFIIPLYNILAIIVLSYYGSGETKTGFKSTFLSVIKNKQCDAAFICLFILAIRPLIPLDSNGELIFSLKKDLSFIYKMIEDANKATPFLSLIVLGGMLEFSQLSGKIRYVIYGSLGRTLFVPAVGLVSAYFLSSTGIMVCTPAEYSALIALFGAPVAFSSAIMAEEMGCDGDLARQLVLWTSITSAFGLFIIISACRALSLV